MIQYRACQVGSNILIAFCAFAVTATAFIVPGALGFYIIIPNIFFAPLIWWPIIIGACAIGLALLLTGLLLVYINSVQLGIRWRVIGLACCLIPVVNLAVLIYIIIITKREANSEIRRIKRNKARQYDWVCRTKYPIFMVHGIMWRDGHNLNYWGRIPEELENNGAVIYYGEHNSSSSCEAAAAEISARLKSIVENTGCEKVNVIAHSKGGLDIRTAIDHMGVAPYIASVTTINTPHRGSEIADYLLNKVPEKEKNDIAKTYNFFARNLGDKNPDFLAGCMDLQCDVCKERNSRLKDDSNIYFQSVGSIMKHSINGRMPTNATQHKLKQLAGENDGLVAEHSFKWGEKYTLLRCKGLRGISHLDVIDFNRENIKGFDVREFYVELVNDLKNRGF